jgi:hypothetical protein
VVDLIQIARMDSAAKIPSLDDRLIATRDAEHMSDDLMHRPVQPRRRAFGSAVPAS